MPQVGFEPGLEERRIPGGAYIDGKWITSELSLAVTDPEDDSLIAHVYVGDVHDMDRAVAGVERSLREDPWELWERRETLERAAAIVRDEADRLARIISAESSKTITEATREAARTAETLRLSAASAHLLEGETLPLADTPRGAGKIGWNRRVPLGVIAAITPFNDPMNLVAHKIGPGLIAGNAIVLKPAQTTPLSALALVDILLRAGMPAKRMAVLVTGREAGTALVSDPRVAAVSFTGGPVTGDALARIAGARKMLMELGGNNAVVVCEDGDVSAAAAGIVDGAFGVAGQNCLSVQRVFVHRSRYDELVAQVLAGTAKLVVGSKKDTATDVGPLISEREAQRMADWVAESIADGARVAIGGERRGAFFTPTVLVDVPERARVLHDEIFGPIVSILPFDDFDRTLDRVNDTDFGLQAGIYTASMATAMYAVERLHVGSVLINETSDFRIDSMPFGGSKRSGVGREGVASAVREMSEPKNVIISRLG
ncbi:aldehyde dehydrogenase family protein [Leucobacter sp. cx-169]|nr:aldehyde dehydrogenase family protein [Leucobacter sp. cx-169]MBC9936298.1 aldehyde dehydrogenase family protein [Leucobacter sp. cx-87]